ncbi:YncE family protein [beta proteobacterium MWH-UniP1]
MSTPNLSRRHWLAASASVSAISALAPASAVYAQTTTAKPAPPKAGVRYPIIVLNSKDADISLIDATSHQVIGQVPTGKEPHHLYPTPDNRHVLVANAVSDTLTVIDPLTGKVEDSIPNIVDPYHLGFSPDQSLFVTCANRLDHVDVYRRVGGADKLALKNVARFNLAKTPSHLIFSEDSKVVYCTLQDSHELVAIDLVKLAVMWRFKTGRLPAGVAISPDSKTLFVGCMGENYVQVIDPRPGHKDGPRSIANLVTGEGAHAFRNQGNKRHLWVSNRVANTISKIDMSTLKIESSIPVPGGPDCMDIHASGKQLWVTQRWTRSVSIVDLDQSKVVKRILVGRSPHGVYLHDRAGLV